MELHVIETSDALTHVALSGKLDIEAMHEVDVEFHGVTAARGKPALVDLADLQFIASLGMGMLISCARSLQRRGARMVLVSPQPMVEEALRAAGVHEGIPIAQDLDAARQLLDSTP